MFRGQSSELLSEVAMMQVSATCEVAQEQEGLVARCIASSLVQAGRVQSVCTHLGYLFLLLTNYNKRP